MGTDSSRSYCIVRTKRRLHLLIRVLRRSAARISSYEEMNWCKMEGIVYITSIEKGTPGLRKDPHIIVRYTEKINQHMISRKVIFNRLKA